MSHKILLILLSFKKSLTSLMIMLFYFYFYLLILLIDLISI